MDGIRTFKTNGSTIHHYTLNGSQIVTETWVTKTQDGEEIVEHPNHFLVYLYDESGAPVGLQYRTRPMERIRLTPTTLRRTCKGTSSPSTRKSESR